MDELNAEEIVAVLAGVAAMPEDPTSLLPDVPDEVIPVQRILELLGNWLEQVDRWSGLIQNAERYVERLAQLEPTAVPHMVLGL